MTGSKTSFSAIFGSLLSFATPLAPRWYTNALPSLRFRDYKGDVRDCHSLPNGSGGSPRPSPAGFPTTIYLPSMRLWRFQTQREGFTLDNRSRCQEKPRQELWFAGRRHYKLNAGLPSRISAFCRLEIRPTYTPPPRSLST